MNSEMLETLYAVSNLTIIGAVIALFIIFYSMPDKTANKFRAQVVVATILALANLGRVFILFDKETLNFTFYFSTVMFFIWLFFAKYFQDELNKLKP